jgi:tetratricopeptide (TPR) repeat protein
MFLRLAFGIACVLFLAAPTARAQRLTVGDEPPPLRLGRFLKGEPIDRLDPRQIHVIMFWGAWDQHLTRNSESLSRLRKTHGDEVRLLGVYAMGVVPNNQTVAQMEAFVKRMGDTMDFAVALDEVPPGEVGMMARNWVFARGPGEFPTYIIKDGKIVWVGVPNQVAAGLEKVLAPGFNLAEASAADREERARIDRADLALQRLHQAGPEVDPKQRVDLINDAIAGYPAMERNYAVYKYENLLRANRLVARQYGWKVVDGLLRDDAAQLNNLAWNQVAPYSSIPRDRRDLKLARKAAERANELTRNQNGGFLDTLALVCFEEGDLDRALELQEKAVELSRGDREIKGRLDQFRAAVAARGKP